MLENAFINKPKQPTQAEVASALAKAGRLWDRLLADLARECGADVLEWNSYSAKAGWSLRVKKKERTIVWLAPCKGAVRVALVLGEKAVQAARQGGLPDPIADLVRVAKKYPEGRAVRLEPKTMKDLRTVVALALIKVEN